jgi:hypothetical protein
VTTYACNADANLPIRSGQTEWLAADARERVLQHFGWRRVDEAWQPPNGAGGLTRAGFLLWDGDAPAAADSYRLCFTDVVDGKLVAVADGLRDAASRFPAMTDVVDAERGKVSRTLDIYFNRLHDESQTDEQRAVGEMYLARMPIKQNRDMLLGADVAIESLPEKLLAQIEDRTVLHEGVPFIRTAYGSTNQVDTYHTRMMKSTLENFAADFEAGLGIQNSHRTDEFSIGRTFDGRYVPGRGNTPARAEGDFYIPPHQKFTDVDTDSIIAGIRWGNIRDVSVGFYGGHINCSLCKKPMMTDLFAILFGGGDDNRDVIDPSEPCLHLPGQDGWERDKKGNKIGEAPQMAVGQVEDARCGELSLVFAGANPGAEIPRGKRAPGEVNGRLALPVAKARRMEELGVLQRPTALALEQQYSGVRFASVTKPLYFVGRSLEPDAAAAQVTGGDDPPDAASTPEQEGTMPEQPVQDGTAQSSVGDVVTQTTTVPLSQPAVANGTLSSGLTSGTTTATVIAPYVDPLPAIRRVMITEGLAPDDFDGDVATRLRELAVERRQDKMWADIGRQARDRKVEEVKAEGIRAMGGQQFKESAYQRVFDGGNWDELDALHEQFRSIAAMRYPGGRLTQERVDSQAGPVEDDVPNSSFVLP